MSERYLRSIRLLAECMQQFEKQSGTFIRQLGLTHAQFDIIATLGNTTGMSCKELGEKTLITKGTLTGVLDRLIAKELISRTRSCQDRRHFFVCLTPKGEQVFTDTFPKVISMMQQRFDDYDVADFISLEQQLSKLKARLE
ncbi:MarR family winged helix-turn-helix transcriptional regulator [Solimicrobium silvestre]|uniref:Transcriptional regulator n=1 Tax=Solimicrobium silvestre TaxID=2099400 RepID=A0A2S9H196_9BURK|nr:MarR family transcriptional regulator [Solimicrobium silvestre]PRC93636.1 Transcriptional regulator [Solimicrobium silvestre]